MVAPVVLDGELVGGSRTGRTTPTWAAPRRVRCPPTRSTIDEEGLRLPPTALDDEVLARIVAASRTPSERRGDLDAQRGANRLGVARFAEIVDALGDLAAFDEILDYGERRMRAALASLPDGRWTFTDVLDSAGPRPEQQSPTPITLTLTVADDTATFDFTGTGAQRPGNVNAVEAVTVSAVAFAVRTATDPTLPANGGAMRPVRVIAPAGSVVAALGPVAVGAGNVEVSQRVADVCLGALAQTLPARVGAAGQGTMNNVLLGGGDGGDGVGVLRDGRWRPGGAAVGARHERRAHRDDEHARHPGRGARARVAGAGAPLRPAAGEWWRGHVHGRRGHLARAGGAGAGDGLAGDRAPHERALGARRRQPTARVGENWLLPAGDEARAERLPDKCTITLAAGDVLRLLTPGGGGWGPAS